MPLPVVVLKKVPMIHLARLQSAAALTIALGFTTGAFAPMMSPTPVAAQTRRQAQFSDVATGHWASQFIVSLASRDIIAGFPDGTFRPDEPVTRAQYAAMVRQAFSQSRVRSATTFVDVPANYWAISAINEAYSMGFLSGYPGNVFRPNQNIPRAQVLVSLANGLSYRASSASSVQYYRDAGAIPDYAIASIAAATENQIVVNYPTIEVLQPNRTATRADVAAFIYQALASQNQVARVSSPYIVNVQPVAQPTAERAAPAGTPLSVAYEDADRIVLLPEETLPLTLNLSQAVIDSRGQVLLPRGSQVVGELRPSGAGSQFVAREIVLLNGQRIAINAASRTVTTTEIVRRGAGVDEILAGAALGSGAAAVIAEITGNDRIEIFEVLAGTATGAIAATIFGRDRVEMITIDPESDLTLTLNESLSL